MRLAVADADRLVDRLRTVADAGQSSFSAPKDECPLTHAPPSADHIIVLDRGSVAEEGSHEKLLALGGIYRGLWEAQIEK